MIYENFTLLTQIWVANMKHSDNFSKIFLLCTHTRHGCFVLWLSELEHSRWPALILVLCPSVPSLLQLCVCKMVCELSFFSYCLLYFVLFWQPNTAKNVWLIRERKLTWICLLSCENVVTEWIIIRMKCFFTTLKGFKLHNIHKNGWMPAQGLSHLSTEVSLSLASVFSLSFINNQYFMRNRWKWMDYPI